MRVLIMGGAGPAVSKGTHKACGAGDDPGFEDSPTHG